MARSLAIIGSRGYPSYYGGFETAVRRLAPYLADRGWDVTVYGRRGSVSTGDPRRDPRIRQVTTLGIESKSLSTLSYGLTSSIHAAVRKPDVTLVLNVANGFFLPLLKAANVPTLVNVDGIEWDRAKWGRLAKLIFHAGAKATARFGSRLVYDSTAIAERWKSEFGTDGAFVPYGADSSVPLAVEPGLTHRGYVLLVARFVPENTVSEFLDAIPSIAARHPVVVVGSSGYGGDLDDRVKHLQASLPNVHALGHISDDRRLFSLWQHAGAYFHGHSVGGTNPALVQAMALGAPVLARDTIYNREVLGDAGLFCAPSAASILKGLDTLMQDAAMQSNLSELATARAAELYSWEGICGLYHDELLTLAESGSARQRRASARQ